MITIVLIHTLSHTRTLIPLTHNSNSHIHADIQRIYQSRISLVDGQIVVQTYEVVGLASVELNLQPPPTYFFDCNTTANNGTGITWPGPLPPLFRVESIPTSTNGKRLSVAGITSEDLGVYTCLDSYTNTTTSVNITMGELQLPHLYEQIELFFSTKAEKDQSLENLSLILSYILMRMYNLVVDVHDVT